MECGGLPPLFFQAKWIVQGTTSARVPPTPYLRVDLRFFLNPQSPSFRAERADAFLPREMNGVARGGCFIRRHRRCGRG